MKFDQSAHVLTDRGRFALSVRTARSAWSRFRGLMLSRPLQLQPVAQGLLIPRCPSVHGFFMRYALDIAYLHLTPGTEQDGLRRYRVTHVTRLKPWGVSWGRRWRCGSGDSATVLRSEHALELPAGCVAAFGMAPGDWVEVGA